MIFSKPSTLALGFCLAAVSLSAAAGPTNVPFSASITTREYLVPPAAGNCGGLPSGISVGSGTATHLGNVAVVATDCIAGVGAPISPGPVPMYSQYAFSKGTLTFKASNGDTLIAQYQGSFVQQSGNVFVINGGTFQIIGGTGRFQNASGGGELRGTEAISLDPTQASQGQLQAIGRISY